MRILIDLQGAQNNSRTRGIGRFVRAFSRALLQHCDGHDIFVLVSELFPDQIDPLIRAFAGLIPPERVIRFTAPGPTAEVDGFVKPDNYWRLGASELLYEKFLADLDMDAVILCTLFEGAQDDSILVVPEADRRYVMAVVLHDLIPLTDPEQYINWAPSRKWYDRKLASLRRADLLLSVSDSAKAEAVDLAHIDAGKVAVISSAVADELIALNSAPEDRQRLLDSLGIVRPFVMHMSAYEPRKNFDGLIRAFAALPALVRDAHQLVLVCKLNDDERAKLNRQIEQAALSPDAVILTNYVSDQAIMALFASCHLFVFPSFHEGFGLPALEAMRCGAPVIGSNLSSIPEVIGRTDALFNPHSTTDMARLIERALTDNAFLADLRRHGVQRAAGFSWERTAKRTIAAIEALHRRHQAASSLVEAVAQYESEQLISAIAKVEAAAPITEKDFTSTAIALAQNEGVARLVRSQARAGAEIIWRIEGPFDSSYSLALVNRETARALAALGHAPSLHSTEGGGDYPANPTFLAAHGDLAALDRAASATPSSKAAIVSRNLFPPRVADMMGRINALHGYAWEETGFPHAWVQHFNAHLDLILVVSRHVEKILIDNGVRVPIAVTGNGVDHWERIAPNPAFRLSARTFRFLHVSSCFPRKGVDDLLDAYGDAFSINDDVSLVIKSFDNPHNEVLEMIVRRQAGNPTFPHVVMLFEDFADSDLKSLYEQCDVMVAPSRAEGYGLPFAEAMLSGLPVITTAWSGQRDFCNPENSWLVDYTFERPSTHFGLRASAWARVDRALLAQAMQTARATPRAERATMAAAGRTELLMDHQWHDVAGRMIDALADLPLRVASATKPKIGWISTWNSRCGIATYSNHLISHMPDDVTIFAAHDSEPVHPDKANCVRCWTSSKTENGLSVASNEITRRNIDVLVIQFNYAFYNHDELCNLIEDANNAGRTIIMMMHSTRDPVMEIPGAELFRIVNHLHLCERILVHSIEDLNRLKSIGLIDNVALFPHGTLSSSTAAAIPAKLPSCPLIATYGFCLPDKGLAELLEAVHLMVNGGNAVRLRMVNAQFPAPSSLKLVQALRSQIDTLGLSDRIELISDFLPDEKSLALLAEADLVVFPYQKSGESASGAVRYGMATGKPVAVTPLAIFDDVADGTFRLPGTGPEAIARGITSSLSAIREQTKDALDIASAAAAWRAEHDYKAIGDRLYNMCVALNNMNTRHKLRAHSAPPISSKTPIA